MALRERERERERNATKSESQLNMEQRIRHFLKQLQLILRTHPVGSVGKCSTYVLYNTQVLFLSPVKSSYLSLPLTPHISCSPTQPSVQFLPLSPTTPVHTSQSAHNIAYRRSYTNSVDTFDNVQKRLLALS